MKLGKILKIYSEKKETKRKPERTADRLNLRPGLYNAKERTFHRERAHLTNVDDEFEKAREEVGRRHDFSLAQSRDEFRFLRAYGGRRRMIQEESL